MKYYIELGAEPSKLVIGLPTYGRSYTLIDGNFTDFGASADGPGEQGTYTREKGFMAFYEVSDTNWMQCLLHIVLLYIVFSTGCLDYINLFDNG